MSLPSEATVGSAAPTSTWYHQCLSGLARVASRAAYPALPQAGAFTEALPAPDHAKSQTLIKQTVIAPPQQVEPCQLLDVLKTRRSIFPKDYSGAQVGREQVEQLLEAANWAPTHGKTEPWRYVVLGKGGIQEMSDLTMQLHERAMGPNSFRTWQHNIMSRQVDRKKVSYMVMICCKRQAKPEKLMPEWEVLCAVAASVQNMHLMAHALGLAGYWSSWYDAARDHPDFKQYLGINLEDRCLGIFMVGSQGPKVAMYRAHRGPIEDKVSWRD